MIRPKQRAVLLWLALGLSIKEVAHAMGLSDKTVEWHWANLRESLNLKSYHDAWCFVWRGGLGLLLLLLLANGCATGKTGQAVEKNRRAAAQAVEVTPPVITLAWDCDKYRAQTFQFIRRTNLTASPWQFYTNVVATNHVTFPRSQPEEYFAIGKTWFTADTNKFLILKGWH